MSSQFSSLYTMSVWLQKCHNTVVLPHLHPPWKTDWGVTASSNKEMKVFPERALECDEPIFCCLKGDCKSGIRGFLVYSFSVSLPSQMCSACKETLLCITAAGRHLRRWKLVQSVSDLPAIQFLLLMFRWPDYGAKSGSWRAKSWFAALLSLPLFIAAILTPPDRFSWRVVCFLSHLNAYMDKNKWMDFPLVCWRAFSFSDT